MPPSDERPRGGVEPWRLELEAWPAERREWWEERAAIRQYLGLIPRDEAEHMAYLDVVIYFERWHRG